MVLLSRLANSLAEVSGGFGSRSLLSLARFRALPALPLIRASSGLLRDSKSVSFGCGGNDLSRSGFLTTATSSGVHPFPVSAIGAEALSACAVAGDTAAA